MSKFDYKIIDDETIKAQRKIDNAGRTKSDELPIAEQVRIEKCVKVKARMDRIRGLI